jgi:cytochrome c oxidase subunit 2
VATWVKTKEVEANGASLKGIAEILGGLLPQALVQTEGGGRSFWLPPQVSTTAPGVDRVFYFIFWIAVIFFVLIVVLMVVFIFRYRRRRHDEKASEEAPTHSTPLELTWSIIPLILVIAIFYAGFKGFLDLSVVPANSYEIQVTGQRWKWLFTYPNGHVDENLHVPVDTPVKLVLTSEDVIHSLFVPEFRIKKDAVPGRYSTAWFRATSAGEYQVFCAEYCGTSHSDMLALVVVHEPGDFEQWLRQAADFLSELPPAEAGSKLYMQRGCAQCHSIDGKGGIGPTFKDVYGTRRLLTDGSEVQVDENYIRQSILEPQSQIVAGFEPVMPTYAGRLRDQEITLLIAFIKSLAPGQEPSDAAEPAGLEESGEEPKAADPQTEE